MMYWGSVNTLCLPWAWVSWGRDLVFYPQCLTCDKFSVKLVEMNSTIWRVPKTWVSINGRRNVATRHNGILSNDVPLFEAAWMKLENSRSFFMLLVVTYFRSIKELEYDHKFGFWKLRTSSRFVSDRFSLFLLLLFLLLVWLFAFCFCFVFLLARKKITARGSGQPSSPAPSFFLSPLMEGASIFLWVQMDFSGVYMRTQKYKVSLHLNKLHSTIRILFNLLSH